MNIRQNITRRINNCSPVRLWYPCFVLPPFLLLVLTVGRHRKHTTMASGKKMGFLQCFDEFEQKSKMFFTRIRKPTTHNFISELKTNEAKERIYNFANRAYPVVHADVIGLAKMFLDNKRKSGTVDERKIYENLQVPGFIDRLITKRPLVFINSHDYWCDKEGHSGQGDWDRKARDDLEHFLSYDEIKISALVQLSSETMLINSGRRSNAGQKGNKDSFIPEAVYVAAVGARFEKPKVMEHQDILQKKTTRKDELFETYYDKMKVKKTSVIDDPELVGESLFHVARYKQRMKLSFETFLLEADQRGQEQGKKVYCHVVGLGMGVWQLPGYPGQVRHWFGAFKESLETLLQNGQLRNLSDIDFSWVDPGNHRVFFDGSQFNSEIKIHVSKRDPFQTLGQKDKNKLLVAMFAWDGNSYVGNEYWEGMLTASGDPAAASCSFIPELLNPDINPNISGGNLRVACPKRGILSYEKYTGSPMSGESFQTSKPAASTTKFVESRLSGKESCGQKKDNNQRSTSTLQSRDKDQEPAPQHRGSRFTESLYTGSEENDRKREMSENPSNEQRSTTTLQTRDKDQEPAPKHHGSKFTESLNTGSPMSGESFYSTSTPAGSTTNFVDSREENDRKRGLSQNPSNEQSSWEKESCGQKKDTNQRSTATLQTRDKDQEPAPKHHGSRFTDPL